MNGDWLVIVNPNAGQRKGIKDWKQISTLLVENNIPFKSVFTSRRNHAISLTRSFIGKGFRNFLVVGGDGTLNEVVNGIFTQNKCAAKAITVALIPVGTGNDWCKTFDVPLDYPGAIEVIGRARCLRQDVGKVSYHQHAQKKTRYFINVAGMGYDALVAQKANRQKDQGKGGPLSYFLNIFSSLFYYHSITVDLAVDGQQERLDLFSLNVGIGRYNGSGLKQTPQADPTDGLLDLTAIKKISKLDVIRHVKKLYDGSFVQLPQVNTYRGKSFRINGTRELFLETDGESLGHSPLDFEVLPQALNVVVGNQPEF